jgi:hypothetical protein
MRTVLLIGSLMLALSAITQQLEVSDVYMQIRASANDPLYTTYAAAPERSRLYGDKAYKMNYFSHSQPLHYSNDKGGKVFTVWMINKLVVDKMEKYYEKPVVVASFPDMAILEYQPFEGIFVQECFFVYSSTVAMSRLYIENRSDKEHLVEMFPVFELGNDSLEVTGYDHHNKGYITQHVETKYRLISDLYAHAPYPTHIRNIFCGTETPYSYGSYRGNLDDFYDQIKTDFYRKKRSQDSLNLIVSGFFDLVALHYQFILTPGSSTTLGYFRGSQDQTEDMNELVQTIEKVRDLEIQSYIDENVELFQSIPRIEFKTEDEKLVYLGALNLARGCMLPPSGETSYNFYVFSRNPLWGWGHGHQVLHESLSMMAYVYLDPRSAMESQRVYMEQQGDDGLIAYRHGPRGAQTYPHKGEPTTSAPFFSWINLELYKVSRDTTFLEDAYQSGVKYVNWLFKHRDTDNDGTFEWGPYGIIENVRDWYNVIFQVSEERYLGVDKEDISDELECLDLTLMVINEMRCLAEMAYELGRTEESESWEKNADATSELVNELMWDGTDGFYYHVDKINHTFQYMGRDLRRQEIIGFLPMWAKVATPEQAGILVQTLTNPEKFWRKYGVPTLAADDEWYSPYVDYCCKWNGPVWLLWNYMVWDGLKKYGYDDIAHQLAEKMMLAVTTQLSVNHNFWESYSPDYTVLDCPSNYIWDSIMAKLLIEVYNP